MSWLFVIYILLLHWGFDFYFQSNAMAVNKSTSLKHLIQHSLTYSLLAVVVCFQFYLPVTAYFDFVVYLFITHMFIDGATSKINSILWKKSKTHWFFVSIGFDQFLHYVAIFWFLEVILGFKGA